MEEGLVEHRRFKSRKSRVKTYRVAVCEGLGKEEWFEIDTIVFPRIQPVPARSKRNTKSFFPDPVTAG